MQDLPVLIPVPVPVPVPVPAKVPAKVPAVTPVVAVAIVVIAMVVVVAEGENVRDSHILFLSSVPENFFSLEDPLMCRYAALSL
jgi:hypothetical protein